MASAPPCDPHPATTQVSGFTCTRALVESVIRQETLADRSSCPGGGGGGGRARAPLTFLNGHSAAQVVLDDSGRTVTGATLGAPSHPACAM